MKRLVTNERKRVCDWVAERIGCKSWGDAAAIGLENASGELIAGVVLDSHRKNGSGSLHCAGIGRTWLNREFLFSVFDYTFRQLNLQALVNTVAANNAASIRFTEHIGFREIYRVRGGWDGIADLILFELRRDDCRWLRKEHEHGLS